MASAPTDLAVMCGACRYRMTVDRYHEGQCPHCHRPFNPRCRLHDKVYFEKQN
ncbi:Zinc finger protein [Lactiplantibacillus plantarum]|nr:Zinc finger protein [Lactiplantibacillus plantarum]